MGDFEYVDGPTLNGDAVEWSYRTVGGATARAGSEVGTIAVMQAHNLIGGGSTTTHGELGPHDIGATPEFIRSSTQPRTVTTS